MGFVLTWLGVYQTAVTAFALVVAIRVWTARPDRFQNRALALVLAMFGLMGFGSQGLIQLTTNYELARISQALLYSLGAAIAFVYLTFIGTLPTPLARPFAPPAVRRVLLVTAAISAVAGAVFLDVFVELVRQPNSRMWMPYHKPAQLWLWDFVAVVVLYGFFAAISMLRRSAPGSPSRAQALIYAAAFGIRDVWYIAALLSIPYAIETPWKWELLLYQFPSLTLVFTALLGYGILRYHLFEIDLKIKWAISRTTLAAIFVAFFFIVTAMAENFLTTRYGWVMGGVGAGLLLYVLTPLQRFAERVADRAMPNVRDDAEYRLVRKLDVYRAAYEGAAQDGVMSDKERDILARLQDQLGITATEVLQIEREVAAGRLLDDGATRAVLT